MGLNVKYLSQPNPGAELAIGEDKEEVSFGRGIDCDVGFPDELTIVSRQHFKLRRELGIYRFVVTREKPVFLNGRPVLNDQELPRVAEIQLSGPTGPKLRLERVEAHGSNQMKTEVLKPQEDLVSVVQQTRTGSRRTMAWLGGVTAALIAVAAGVWLLTQRVDEQAASLRDQMAAMGNTAQVAEIVERHRASVYLVTIELPSGTRAPGGTAWVVQLPDGRKALATNAHVADLFRNDIKTNPSFAGGRLVATQPLGPDYQTVVITGVEPHPAWDAFNAFAKAYAAKQAAGVGQKITFPPSYDVALLTVDDPAKLGAPLTIASEATLEAMKAGEPLVLIGYPAENLLGTDLAKPEPTSQTGIVTSVTSFFLSRGAPTTNQLIQHSLPSAGGASGSPIFNAKGEVVGLHNAANMTILQGAKPADAIRINSAALVNYAQRADLMAELIAGQATAHMPAYEAEWREAEARFTKSADQIIADQVQNLRVMAGEGAQISLILESAGTMSTSDPLVNGARVAWFDADLPGAGLYMAIGGADDQRNIVAVIVAPNGQIADIGTRGAFFSTSLVNTSGPTRVRIGIVDDVADPAADTRPPGAVRLQVYRGAKPQT